MNKSKNSDREKAFFSAVKNGDIATVKQMVGETKQLLRAYDYDEFGGPCLNLADRRTLIAVYFLTSFFFRTFQPTANLYA